MQGPRSVICRLDASMTVCGKGGLEAIGSLRQECFMVPFSYPRNP